MKPLGGKEVLACSLRYVCRGDAPNFLVVRDFKQTDDGESVNVAFFKNQKPVFFPIATKPPRYKCGISKACPEKHFAFKMASGAANVVGPKICLEDNV